MKKINLVNLILLLFFTLASQAKIYSQTTNSKKEVKMETIQATKTSDPEQILIDKLIVPEKAKQEFIERLDINRNFIKQLPGFIKDAVYERSDGQGSLVYVTIAVWQNEEALKNAKEAVQVEYRKQNFDLQEMLKRLNITIDRGIYKKTAD